MSKLQALASLERFSLFRGGISVRCRA